MKQKFCQAIVLPETKRLVEEIAAATYEKKFVIYDRAIKDYAKKQLASTTN